MSQPTFILVRPQMGENIGGAARAMWNFGLDRMRLVEPRDGWPNPRAVALASGAGRLLDNAGHFDSVAEAIGDCTHVYATTARGRGITKPVVSPEEAMAEARAVTKAGGKVGVLFGPERAGLENEDVARANAIVTVPVNPAFFSLNLAQCVLLMAYEWGRQTAAPARVEDTERAKAIEVEKLAEHFDEKLTRAGFFFPPEKAPGMRLVVRNMLSRLALSRADVQIFHGMLRQLTRPQMPSETDRPDP
ncbi:RNA methyltransferase [Tropicimonas isoalkanivorans]|uniref:tRNA/rRNA methyltransferase n=1 Tax=Tropicimonas isoalkanivorans TaxID=441112 RepID=A0A1I1DA11_9RHOB|nr:RNA methyltransferase [Tropicimonas isoalkanivorans]SFB71657.1 tRNA/rRNA methyltransferase [Tropicimonas isoalkanivorans]